MEKVHEIITKEVIDSHYIHYVYDTYEEYKEHRSKMEYDGYEVGRVCIPYKDNIAVKVFYCKETTTEIE